MKYLFFIIILTTVNKTLFAYETFHEMADAMAKKFDAPIISAEQLDKLINTENIVLIDSREREEFLISHIKGAINMSYKDFSINHLPKIISKNTKIIVYCSVGYRSGDIAARMKKNGFDSYNLYGGIFGWNNSGRALYIRDSNPTNQVHGYNRSWGKWLTRGKVIY